jgi:hypothetical protein
MKNKRNTIIIVVLTLYIFITAGLGLNNRSFIPSDVSAKIPPTLYDTIAHMDSVMFDAFNNRSLEKLKSLFTTDLEFFHDKDGLAGYDKTMENFTRIFNDKKLITLKRELVKGSLEVYPIFNYGAVEICRHQFCHIENGKNDCGIFKNIMIWHKLNGQWKVSRVISYDHR